MCSSMCNGSIGIIVVGFLFCIIFFIIAETKICEDRDKVSKLEEEKEKLERYNKQLEEEKCGLIRYIHLLDKKVEEIENLKRWKKYLEKKIDILEQNIQLLFY